MTHIWSLPQEICPGYIGNGRWELLSQLGEGAFGVCFSARDRTGRVRANVAIKISKTCATESPVITTHYDTLAKEEASFFERCMDIQAYIPRYYGTFVDLGCRFLVTQLLDNDMNHHGIDHQLNPEFAAELAHDLSQSLYALHEQIGYCHRDIKPGNILIKIRDGERVGAGGPIGFLADFGLAAPLSSCLPSESLGEWACGTSLFWAPECWELGGTQGAAADIWAMGLSLLFEFKKGKLPKWYRKYRKNGAGLLKELITSLREDWIGFTREELIADPMLCQFLTACLMIDPTQRMTARQCVLHPWLQGIRRRRQKFHFAHTSTFLEPISFSWTRGVGRGFKVDRTAAGLRSLIQADRDIMDANFSHEFAEALSLHKPSRRTRERRLAAARLGKRPAQVTPPVQQREEERVLAGQGDVGETQNTCEVQEAIAQKDGADIGTEDPKRSRRPPAKRVLVISLLSSGETRAEGGVNRQAEPKVHPTRKPAEAEEGADAGTKDPERSRRPPAKRVRVISLLSSGDTGAEGGVNRQAKPKVHPTHKPAEAGEGADAGTKDPERSRRPPAKRVRVISLLSSGDTGAEGGVNRQAKPKVHPTRKPAKAKAVVALKEAKAAPRRSPRFGVYRVKYTR